jgi:hypothetical protein
MGEDCGRGRAGRLLSPLLALCLVACQVRERAGVAPPVWRADSVLTDIAGASRDGNLNFTIPAGATRLSSGTVVIGDRHGGVVRFFDPEGRQVGSYGRFGEGPGEFGGVSWLGQCARDTVLVWDARLSRFTLLDGRGELVRQVRNPVGDHRTPPLFLACAPAGPLAALRLPADHGMQSPRSTAPMARTPVDLLDDSGRIVHQVGEVASGTSQVLGRLTKLAVAPSLLYVGTAESAAVDVYDSTGRPVGIVRVGTMTREVSDAHWARAVEERLWLLALPRDRDALRDLMLALPRPTYLPPYSTIAADTAGTLWAGLSFPGDTASVLRGVRPDGSPVADIVLPAGVSVIEVGMDYVLGMLEDETGELHVVVLRLDRSESAT